MPRLQRTAALLAALLLSVLVYAPPAQARHNPHVQIVYVRGNGRGLRYHRRGCRILRNAVRVVAMPRGQANARGYLPCKVCKP